MISRPTIAEIPIKSNGAGQSHLGDHPTPRSNLYLRLPTIDGVTAPPRQIETDFRRPKSEEREDDAEDETNIRCRDRRLVVVISLQLAPADVTDERDHRHTDETARHDHGCPNSRCYVLTRYLRHVLPP